MHFAVDGDGASRRGITEGCDDFLGTLEAPAMTDVNSTQGLQNFPEGYAALIRYFGQCLNRS